MQVGFGNWLAFTRQHAAEVYGNVPAAMDDDEFAEYIRTNFLAAHTELGEAIQHLPWRPWRPGEGRPVEPDRTLAVRELVDAVKFVGNILTALAVTDEEFAREFERKSRINASRQDHHYEASA